MRNQLLASVSSRFAHLANFGRKRAKSASEDEEEEKDKKDSRAEDTDEDERMEGDDDEKEASAETDDDKDDDEPKSSKKGKGEGDDERCEDDDDGDKKEAKAQRRGRRMERKRTAAVLSSPQVARNLPMAAALLAETSMSADAIITAVKASGSVSASNDRGARNPRIDTSVPERSDAKSIEASWDRAIKRAAPAGR